RRTERRGGRPIGVRGWRAVNALFLVTTILEALAMGHLTAFTPLFLAELGLERQEVNGWTGLLYGAMMAVAFPLAPFWGALAERYSRRLIIVRSQYLAALAYAATAFAPDIWWALTARLVLGLTFGNIAVVIATQAQLTPRRHLGTAIATIQVAAPVAASIGPPVGAALIGQVGLRGLFLIDAALALVAALLTTFLMPEPERHRPTTSVLARTRHTAALVWDRPAVRWNFGGWFLAQGGRATVDAYLPLRIAELVDDPAPIIGLVLGVYGVLTAVATWLAAKLVDEDGGIRWLLPSMAVAAVATVAMVAVPSVWVVAVSHWSRALAFAAANTLLYAHLARCLPPTEQTAVMSLTPMPRNVAMFVVPMLAAAVAPLGVGAALLVGAGSYAGGAVVGRLAERATRAGGIHPASAGEA
ncbi:MAG: MFS transporter, partial [Chloroflexota bacterium]|nr:MFS transporter [Chloroflexota bacterium]